MPTSNETDSKAARPGIPVRDDVPLPPADTAVTRRTALQMFSASTLLLMGVGCTRKPERHILSMPERPEYQRPGKELYYASTWTEGSRPYGIMVKHIDGRPVKVEGLPDHPLNRGASSAAMQATLLSLYDPKRLRTPMRGEKETTWEAADREIVAALGEAQSVAIVTRATLGPAERDLVRRFVEAAPGGRHFVHEAAHDGLRRQAWKTAYGADGEVLPQLSSARIILSIDDDFLGADGDVLTATRDFAKTRRPQNGEGMSRLYVAESAMTVTGSNADHRIPLEPSAALDLVEALRAAMNGDPMPLVALKANHGLDTNLLRALAVDLGDNRGAAVVTAGPHLPPAVHASVALLNDALGTAKTLRWNPEPVALPVDEPTEIAAALDKADVAVFLGVNPAYDGIVIGDAKFRVGHGLTANETLGRCSIALPSAHNLESWNDAVPLPGVRTLCQPMIAPLFDARQEMDSLLLWTKALAPGDADLTPAKDFHDFVQRAWQQGPLGSTELTVWEAALRGGIHGTPRTDVLPAIRRAPTEALVEAGMPGGGDGGYDLVIRPHTAVHDGRFSGNAWLLELPEPTSKLVWDNAAIMSPATAKALGTAEGKWVTVDSGKRSAELPVLEQAGVAPNTVVVHLGFGRAKGAATGDGVGVNAAPLMGTGPSRWAIFGAKVAKKSRAPHALVRTQMTFDQKGREHAMSGTLAEYEADKSFPKHRKHIPPLDQIDEPYDYSKTHKWGLAIDLNACTGCEACVIACQSENNIPTVGKEEVAQGREMSWIRLDRYEEGGDENPTVSQQPMLCQHCDNAPCESVCPVNATAHSPEGLNDQVYNRCVGTRYCANNCPYKVRRFNFFNYPREFVEDPVQELLFNPNVTVRMRGVMEKCTFCVQRINAAKFEASNLGEPLPDGAVVTACQQACPADAIVFGDVNVEDSAIAKARQADLAYHVLEELNVRPNVTYMARVRNPSPRATGGDR